MKLEFKRIISSGTYIPAIDGLRFIAIFSVVLFHISCFISEKQQVSNYNSSNFDFIIKIISHGYFGVSLFFIISGFILGIPFANFYLKNGNRVSLKKYFLRRLTRLEVPYVLTMTILLFGVIFVAKSLIFNEAVKSYLASIFYIHNFTYPDTLPKLNTPAWSLEIEVQFYILAPLLANLFSIKSTRKRRTILILIALFSLGINNYLNFQFLSIINFIHFFIVGFILSDLYVTNTVFLPKINFDYIIVITLFVVAWMFDKNDFNTSFKAFLWELFQLLVFFIFYYYVLIHDFFRFLSFKIVTNIGGMCYSIYLLHYPIISLVGNKLLKHSFSENLTINNLVLISILLLVILVISSIFFLLVERPCMDKEWIKKGYKWINSVK